jgi:hypothetical protein
MTSESKLVEMKPPSRPRQGVAVLDVARRMANLDTATDIESLSLCSAGIIGLGKRRSPHASGDFRRHTIMHHVFAQLL